GTTYPAGCSSTGRWTLASANRRRPIPPPRTCTAIWVSPRPPPGGCPGPSAPARACPRRRSRTWARPVAAESPPVAVPAAVRATAAAVATGTDPGVGTPAGERAVAQPAARPVDRPAARPAGAGRAPARQRTSPVTGRRARQQVATSGAAGAVGAPAAGSPQAAATRTEAAGLPAPAHP